MKNHLAYTLVSAQMPGVHNQYTIRITDVNL